MHLEKCISTTTNSSWKGFILGNSTDRNTQCALLSSVNKTHCRFSLRCKLWQCKHDPGPGYMSTASSLSTSVQAAHYIKHRGLGAGSICEVRTARRDTRNIGRIVGQILTRSLPTAALSKHPLTDYGLRQHERSEHNVWVNTRPDATELSPGRHHRDIFHMPSPPSGRYHT